MPNSPATARSRRWLILGGYAALAATTLLVCLLHYSGVAAARAAVDRYQGEIEHRLQTKKSLVDANTQIQNIEFQVRNFPRLVPEDQDLGSFLEQLSSELSLAGMKDVDIKNQAAITMGRCQKLPIQLHASGTFAQFHQFLEKVEHFDRLCSVGHITIETADPEMDGRVKVDLTLFIYSSKPE